MPSFGILDTFRISLFRDREREPRATLKQTTFPNWANNRREGDVVLDKAHES